MGIFACIMVIILLKRKRERINIMISSFFLCFFIASVLNVIYVFVEIEQLAVPMQFITYFFFSISIVFLLVCNLILLKSELVITTAKQGLIIGIFGVLFLLLLLIPEGIQINESTGYIPKNNLPYLIFALILVIGYAMIPTLYTSILIYRRFSNKDLKKRWFFYIFGFHLYFIEWVGVSVANYLNDPTIRLIWNTFALSLFISAYFIFYGIGRQVR